MKKEDRTPKVCLIASEDGVMDEEAVGELARPLLTKTHVEPSRSAGGFVAEKPDKGGL